MLFSAQTAQNIFDTIGGVTYGIMAALLPYLWVALGIFLAFRLAMLIISLFKHGVSGPKSSGSDTDQLRRAGSDSETQAEINKQFPLM